MAACAFLLLTGLIATAAFAEPHPCTQLTIHSDAIVRHNPLGAVAMGGLFCRRVLADDPALGPTRYLQGGVALSANPAYAQMGAHLEWMPAVFVILRAQYDRYAFFGVNRGLLSFPSGQSRFGDDEMSALSGQEESAWGNRAAAQLVLRAKIGGLILRNQTDVGAYWFGGKGRYVYESEYDTLIKARDVIIANRVAAPWQLWSHGPDAILLIGPSYELVRSRGAHLHRQRLGGLIYFVPTARIGAFARPRFFALSGINLQDRNRDGQFFVVAGLGTDFDL